MSSIVLIADADPFALGLLEDACRGAGFEVATAFDGRQALEQVAREPPAAILLAAALPETSGLEVLQVLRDDPELSGIPVIIAAEASLRDEALRSGAEGVVGIPYQVQEVQARVRNAIREARDRRRRERESVLPLPPEALDPHTGAGSKAQLLLTLDYEVTRSERFRFPLSCMVLQVRPASPSALRTVTEGVRATMRNVDTVFRAGEGELAVVLPETAREGGEVARERLERRLQEEGLAGGATVAFGLATTEQANIPSGTDLLRLARANASTGER